MSSAGIRERSLLENRLSGRTLSSEKWLEAHGVIQTSHKNTSIGKQITVSESNPRNHKTGAYLSGGKFYTSLVRDFLQAGYIENNYNQPTGQFYTGPVYGNPPSQKEKESLGYQNVKGQFGAENVAQMTKDGTNAISYSSPINPASNLGTSLAEGFREGIPTLPGIQAWKRRTELLKGLGSEYLNYQFGWAPLHDEVSSVVKAARNHRDLLSQYHRGEGSSTHRRFDYPLQRTVNSGPVESPGFWSGLPWEWNDSHGTRQVSVVTETKRWFEGVFTYALPSSTDSWRRAIGFGSDADQLFGIALSPDILWELTPWSWAVDWFSNAGEVINNVTNFGLAGLVMRYGYMMEETIERVTASGTCPTLRVGTYATNKSGKEPHWELSDKSAGGYSCGTESVTKRRLPASPFGFSIGWEGLSPTQLAITAALGITRLL